MTQQLCEQVFGLSRTLDFYKWQNELNPYGKPLCSLAWTSEGELIGQCTGLPLAVNVNGSRRLALQAVELMVDSRYRRRGLFIQMALHVREQARKRDVFIEVAFPTRKGMSFQGFVEKLGWRAANEFIFYSKKISGASDVAAQEQVKFEKSVPVGYEAMWDRIRTETPLCIWKDSEYFRWRYDSHPVNKFGYAYLDKNNAIEALAVFLVRKRTLHIVELSCMEQKACADLLNGLEQKGAELGCEYLEHTGSSPLLDTYFDASWKKQLSAWTLCTRPVNECLDVPGDWTISRGDTDNV